MKKLRIFPWTKYFVTGHKLKLSQVSSGQNYDNKFGLGAGTIKPDLYI